MIGIMKHGILIVVFLIGVSACHNMEEITFSDGGNTKYKEQ